MSNPKSLPEVLTVFNRRFAPREFRKPFARKPEEFDDAKPGSVLMFIYRDFHSLEVEVQIKDGKAVEAVVTTDCGEHRAGTTIELTWEEQREAERMA